MKQWLKKHSMMIAACLLCLGAVLAVNGFLHSQGKLIKANPIHGLCEKRSHIAVTGKNYTLDGEQEKEYLEEVEKVEEQRKETPPQKEQQQEQPEKPNETVVPKEPVVSEPNNIIPSVPAPEQSEGGTPSVPTPEQPDGETPGGGMGQGEGNDGENTGGTQDVSKLPTIICNLTEGQEVSGKFLSFTVKAISYTEESLDSFFVSVTVNGNKIYSSGEQHGVISYRCSQELQEGSNEVVITATDREKHQATKRYHVMVNAEESQKVGGTMRVTLRADVLGLGVILQQKVTFYEGENLPYIVDRAFRQAGMRYDHTGTFDYGFYLSRIHRPGITNGYQIPAPILAKLEEENSSWVGYETDSLGEKDFYYWSGWVYKMDGYFPGGLSTVPAEDGSEMEILFTLNNGAEYNGMWFNGNW